MFCKRTCYFFSCLLLSSCLIKSYISKFPHISGGFKKSRQGPFSGDGINYRQFFRPRVTRILCIHDCLNIALPSCDDISQKGVSHDYADDNIMVNISGYVSRKRSVSKNLTFIDLELGMKDNENVLNKVTSIQVILGATIIRSLGVEMAQEVMRSLSVGQCVRVYGRRQQNPEHSHLTDIVTYDIAVLGGVNGRAESTLNLSFHETFPNDSSRVEAFLNSNESQTLVSTILNVCVTDETRDTVTKFDDSAGKEAMVVPVEELESIDNEDNQQLPFLKLDIAPHKLHLVDDLASLTNMKYFLDRFRMEAEAALMRRTDGSGGASPLAGRDLFIIGFDCEWQPEGNYTLFKARKIAAAAAAALSGVNDTQDETVSNSSQGKPRSRKLINKHRASDVSVLQISTRTDVFVIDLARLCIKRKDVSTAAAILQLGSSMSDMRLEEQLLDEALGKLFQSPAVLKVGMGPVNDLKRLAWSHWSLRSCRTISSVLDIQHLAARAYQDVPKTALEGLSKLCVKQFGKRLNKEAQCSNWAYRPLAPFEIEYAALDAYVLTRLFDSLFDSIPCTNDLAAKKLLRSLSADYAIIFPNTGTVAPALLLATEHNISNNTVRGFMPLNDVRIVASRR